MSSTIIFKARKYYILVNDSNAIGWWDFDSQNV